MKDIFSSYHKHKVLSHVSLVVLSAIFAMGINLLLVETPASMMLQANILGNDTPVEKIADFSAFVRGSELIFQTHEPIQNAVELSFSLAYDPEVLKLGSYTSSVKANTIDELKNEDGFVSYILRFENPLSLPVPSEILSLNFEKLQEKTVFVNPIQINFKDQSGETYLLSSSQIQF